MFTVTFDPNKEINGVHVAGDYKEEVKRLQDALNNLLTTSVRAADDGATKVVKLPALKQSLVAITDHLNGITNGILGSATSKLIGEGIGTTDMSVLRRPSQQRHAMDEAERKAKRIDDTDEERTV